MFCKGILPFRTMKSALMSFGEEKKVVCQLPQNMLSLIKMKKSLVSNVHT